MCFDRLTGSVTVGAASLYTGWHQGHGGSPF